MTQEHTHLFSLATALAMAAVVHQFRREAQAVQERAEAVMAIQSAWCRDPVPLVIR